MNAPGEHHEASRLSRIWDGLIAGVPSRNEDDAALLADIHLVEQSARVPAAPPDLKVRVWNELMRQAPPSLSAAVTTPAFEPNGHLPNQAIPVRRLGRVRLRTAMVLSLSRWIAIGVIAGFAAGFATGLWTRVAMRLAGILTVDRNRGLLTENDAAIGQLSLAGTLSLAMFGAMIGVVGGLVYVAIRTWLPRNGWLRAVGFGALLLAVFGFVVMDPGNPDYRRFGPPWFNVLTFSLAYVLCGAGISFVADRLDRRIPLLVTHRTHRTGSFAWLVVLAPFTLIGVIAIVFGFVNLMAVSAGGAGLFPLTIFLIWRVSGRWFNDIDLRRRGNLLLRNLALLAPAAVGVFLTLRSVFEILAG
ncbi:MAG: hypothetical protein WKF63_05180 [Thermomicrobiales bacterium]